MIPPPQRSVVNTNLAANSHFLSLNLLLVLTPRPYDVTLLLTSGAETGPHMHEESQFTNFHTAVMHETIHTDDARANPFIKKCTNKHHNTQGVDGRGVCAGR